ncbi:DUF1481 domain-containing protein [Yersinia ruckeri]|nr:DUF1481 domain-containing protein [Yersinia ruckeri]AKA38467.1 hypothetical protein UGYR_08705 [Yersinia ruckeri]AUQ41280.1 DUF1481 domain-containing protein [Yersinia ruckeri]EEP98107.1 hypothetical protein yruck0001_1320 [Yersinia ruckeri ATCC 29473]EKN4199812.1 DUF1481 domain-containing protein [Yersinia ruckeri]EKN4206432.1 DUF1481 domain-containing protein [Yersinia ruckeri]
MRRVLMTLGLVIGVSACSGRSDAPQFSASGYIADSAVVRIWRHDDSQQHPQVIMTVYSPYRGDVTRVTFYEYQNGILRQIRQSDIGKEAQSLQLRFSEQGVVSFMQRQLASSRELLTADEITFQQFEAKRILELSTALRAGNVNLMQGRFQNGVLTGCNGVIQRPQFEDYAQTWLNQRAKNTKGPLGIAWLNAPEGQALLLVANEDFCRWEPTADSL